LHPYEQFQNDLKISYKGDSNFAKAKTGTIPALAKFHPGSTEKNYF